MKVGVFILLFCWLKAESKDATVTIYRDGTALIKQPVSWSVKKGINSINWDNLPKNIQQDTPFLSLENASVLSQRFNNKVFTSNDYYQSLKGQKINVKPQDGKMVSGELLEINPVNLTVKNRSGIFTFNRSNISYLGAINQILSPVYEPYLSWRVQSNISGKLKGQLVYKSKNFSWSTVYRIKMEDEINGELIAEAVINNNSNLDFRKTSIQLVEGQLHNFKNNKISPQKNKYVMAPRLAPDPGMTKDDLGDYHIYQLNDLHDLSAKESVTVRMYGPLNVKYKKTYVFENSERRQKEEPLEVKITLKNVESNGLGIPLPDGKIELYTFSSLGGLEYIGADKMGQVPKGQSTDITSGRAFDVIGNRKVLNYDRQRKSEEAVIEIKVTNARNENINVLLVEHINGDWIIKDESLDYQKKDASTIHFPMTLNSGETKNVYYTYRKEWK